MNSIQKVTALHPQEHQVSRADFERYLTQKGWFYELGVWREKDGKEMTCLNNLQTALEILERAEKRASGLIVLDIIKS